jgi:GNAT superfamily N-acetyltransferase
MTTDLTLVSSVAEPKTAKGKGAKAKAPLKTLVTHLEMRNPPIRPPKRAPLARLMVLRVEHCPVHFYRYLYHEVGKAYHWLDRTKISDADLAAILGDPKTELTIAYADGAPAGYGELKFESEDEARLVYFGMMPEFQRLGIGSFLLDTLVRGAWARGIKVLKVETCTLDHPLALASYQKMGFVPVSQEERTVSPH